MNIKAETTETTETTEKNRFLRALRVFCGKCSLVFCAVVFVALPAAADQTVGPAEIQALIQQRMEGELAPLGMGNIAVQLQRPPAPMVYADGAKVVLQEMGGHMRLGIRRFKIAMGDIRGGMKTAFVYARVSADVPVVRARYPIPTDKQIVTTDLAIGVERRDELSMKTILDAEQIIGRTAGRAIAQGDEIQTGHIRKTHAVRKGEIIEVEIQLGSVTAKVYAEALQAAYEGERIPFKNTVSMKRFFATVTGPRQARVIVDGDEGGQES